MYKRQPLLPCPFYVEGRRYQINAISDYDSGNGWCKIYLDADSNSGTGYDESQFGDGRYYRDIFLQTSGNRSLLAQNFTQINDLGYGLVANNGAVSEQVSTFTYYNHAAFYAFNGSEIRALNCSNGYGNFGLVAEGADPNEIPDQVTLRDRTMQPAKTVTTSTFTNAVGDTEIYVTELAQAPLPNSHVTIEHGGSTGTLNYLINAVEAMSDSDNDQIFGEIGDVHVTGVESVTNIGAADGSRSAGTYTDVQGAGGAQKNISGATQTNPVRITTTTPHNLRDGARIVIAAVGGMTQLTNNPYYAKIVSSNVGETQFDLYSDEALTTTVDGTAYGAYTSGGTVNGGGASFNITVDGTGAATSVTVNRGGQNYATGETITIADADIGNGGGANLTFDVVAVANTLGIGNISCLLYTSPSPRD